MLSTDKLMSCHRTVIAYQGDYIDSFGKFAEINTAGNSGQNDRHHSGSPIRTIDQDGHGITGRIEYLGRLSCEYDRRSIHIYPA